MWALDGLANFSPYAAFPLLLAGPVSLFVRRRAMTLVAVALFAVWLAIIAAPNAFVTLAHDRPADAPRLRVVTANVLMSNDQLPALAADVLAQAPDVIVFQELRHDLAEFSPALAAAYPYRISTETPWVTLASRLPLDDARRLAHSGSDRARDLLTASIEVAGQRVQLVAVHVMPPLDAEAFRMTNEQRDLLETAVGQSTSPLLVIGDFNATALSPGFARLLLSTRLRIAAASRLLEPTYFAYGRFGVRIDHVLVRRLSVAQERVFGLTGSDHRGVSVEVSLPATASTTTVAQR